MFDFTWTKDGAPFEVDIRTVGNGELATVAVPNGEYLSSLEDTYTCRVSLGGVTRGSRNIIVTLPGEPRPVCTSPTSHTHAQSCKGSVMYHDLFYVYLSHTIIIVRSYCSCPLPLHHTQCCSQSMRPLWW